MGRVISIFNQKGGVGKTATSINLSSSFAKLGKKVLLIDMDPQGNTSRGFGVDTSLISRSIVDIFKGNDDLEKLKRKTPFKTLDLISSKLALATIDNEITMNEESKFILKGAINKVKDKYDYIILDCPPYLGFLGLNTLIASDTVLVPIQCEYFASKAISSILANISYVQAKYNPSLKIEGFLLTMYDSKVNLCNEIALEVRSLFKDSPFVTTIPKSISIPESNAKGLPIIVYRPTCKASQSYISLAKEIFDRENYKG